MKRWTLKAGATDPSGLVIEDVATPEPGPGEVRVRVRAVSLDARDRMVMGGHSARLPDRDLVPVSDGAGEVDAVGAGVTGWAVGDGVTNLFFPTWTDRRPVVDHGFGPGGMDWDGMLSDLVVLPTDGIAHASESPEFAGPRRWPAPGDDRERRTRRPPARTGLEGAGPRQRWRVAVCAALGALRHLGERCQARAGEGVRRDGRRQPRDGPKLGRRDL